MIIIRRRRRRCGRRFQMRCFAGKMLCCGDSRAWILDSLWSCCSSSSFINHVANHGTLFFVASSRKEFLKIHPKLVNAEHFGQRPSDQRDLKQISESVGFFFLRAVRSICSPLDSTLDSFSIHSPIIVLFFYFSASSSLHFSLSRFSKRNSLETEEIKYKKKDSLSLCPCRSHSHGAWPHFVCDISFICVYNFLFMANESMRKLLMTSLYLYRSILAECCYLRIFRSVRYDVLAEMRAPKTLAIGKMCLRVKMVHMKYLCATRQKRNGMTMKIVCFGYICFFFLFFFDRIFFFSVIARSKVFFFSFLLYVSRCVRVQ